MESGSVSFSGTSKKFRNRIGVMTGYGLSVLFCFFGFKTINKLERPENKYIKTEGIVSSMRAATEEGDSTVMIAFKVETENYSFIAKPGNIKRELMEEGQKVNLYYNQENPRVASVFDLTKGWGTVVLIFTISGFLFLTTSFLVFWKPKSTPTKD